MAKVTEGWKVTAISVRFIDGKRVERPFADFTPQERKEIAQLMNDRALRAAGYFPVEESTRKNRSRAAGAGKKGVVAYG